jgi:hypothetical protein
MAKIVHGEVKLNFHSNGNWQDLVSILLTNGYTLEMQVDNGKLIVIIMTEAK